MRKSTLYKLVLILVGIGTAIFSSLVSSGIIPVKFLELFFNLSVGAILGMIWVRLDS